MKNNIIKEGVSRRMLAQLTFTKNKTVYQQNIATPLRHDNRMLVQPDVPTYTNETCITTSRKERAVDYSYQFIRRLQKSKCITPKTWHAVEART